MDISRTLLFKGLGGVLGVGAVAAVTTLGVMSLDEDYWLGDVEFIRNAGLDCGETIENGGECKVISDEEEKKVNFERDGKKATEIDLLSGGKIKVYRNQSNYRRGLKFSIEERDIDLNGDNEIPKLEEFETYEIKYLTISDKRLPFLTRKTEASPVIEGLLGLPKDCHLPKENESSECKDLNQEALNSINFSRENKEVIVAPATLTITKLDESNYPLGYKFSFKSGSSNSQDYKIKKENGGLSLERDWKLAELADKVGLQCTGDTCSLKSSPKNKLNVKRDNVKGEEIDSISGSGKIKVQSGQVGYMGGFRFSIEEDDIVLNGGTGEVNKLEQFESYEIVSEGSKYFLSRKDDGLVEKLKVLGLPGDCKELTCTIDKEADFKKIKFLNINKKGTYTFPSGTKLNVVIGRETQWPGGLKVSFNPGDKEPKIPRQKEGNFILWKNYTTDYRAKKDKNNWSLERVDKVGELAKKAGLEDCIDDMGCSLAKGGIDIFISNEQYISEGKVKNNSKGKRIKYVLGAEGYNEKVMFTVDPKIEMDVDQNYSSTKSGTIKELSTGNYEIKKAGSIVVEDRLFLVKKT